jgi:hypothetical protein
VQAVGSVDDHSRDFIFFHAASLCSFFDPAKQKTSRLGVFA